AGSPYNTLEKIRRIVEMTNAASPDLILLPGDFFIQGMPGGEHSWSRRLWPWRRKVCARGQELRNFRKS
ncbi:MAG: hypothetical protein J2P21_33870, partial [Chloracidobacterium sp.]|nr:hypothetical protein [Chloracidobacterium sp.]